MDECRPRISYDGEVSHLRLSIPLRLSARTSDTLLTVAVLLLGLTFMTFGERPDDREIDFLAVVLVTVASGAVLFRRTSPIAALAVATVLGFGYWILDYPNAGAAVAILVLLYSSALYTPDARAALRALIVFTIALLLVLVAGFVSDSEDEVSVGVIVINMIMFELAWFAGDSVRNRGQRIRALEARVRASETEQGAQTERAVVAERTRIARELHDIVAHSMSVVVVQAEAAKRNVGVDDDAVRSSIEAIETVGRTNLNDIRGIVGLLRDANDDRVPNPQLSMISQLVDQCSEAGLAVSLVVLGDERPLPAMIELSGYRIVQESLTNAIKHAGPNASATITLDYQNDALSISVVDDGRGAAADRTLTPGHGLLGMRERVEAFGGALRTGPRAGGGYSVEVNLPVMNA